MCKLEFWKLEIKFGNWNFENHLRMEFWKLNLKEIKILKFGILKIKFES